jgi:hypothetical protein
MFENPEAGIAALNQDIGIKLRRGLDTPLKFISVYAPAADRNDVGAYASNVARALNIGPNDRIPDTPEARSILASAITRQEGAHKATARFNNGGPVSFAGNTDGSLVDDEPQSEFGRDIERFKKYQTEPGINESIISGIRNLGRSAINYFSPSKDIPIPTNNFTPQQLQQQQIVENEPNRSEPLSMPQTLPGIQDPARYGLNNTFAPAEAAPMPTAIVPAEVPEDIREIRALLKERAIEAKKQKETDKYMALLQASLGIMGGTSPYAFANIGQGGSAGIAAYAASRKAQTADENAILAGRLGLSKAELLEKSRQNALAVNEKRYNEELKRRTNLDLQNKNIAESKIAQTQKANKIKETVLRNKAIKDWNDSPDKAILEKDLADQRKDWRKDTKLVAEYERKRQNFIKEQTLEYGADAIDANEIAPLPQQ